MNADFVSDLDIVDPETVEQSGPNYPVAQWLNGDPKMAAVGGVAHTGGLILPTKYVDDNLAPAPGWARATVAFGNGKTESVLAAPKPRLAVIRTRFRWFVIYNGVATYYPRAGYVAASGMRGHVQALCAVHGFDFPIVVTFKGKASQEFERLLKDFSQKVQDAAFKAAREKAVAAGTPSRTQPRFPRFAFYMRLAPSPHIKAGQKGQESIITPPVVELPSVISNDYLGKIYVGRDRLVELQQMYHDAAEWAAAWDRPGAEESDSGAQDDHGFEDEHVDPETGEVGGEGGSADILTETQALAALKAHKINESVLRQALQQAHQSYQYVPDRDTQIVRLIISNRPDAVPF